MSLQYNKINTGCGRNLLLGMQPDTTKLIFFDPQYRGVLDKLSYGNEGQRQKARSELPQMTDETIKEFLHQINFVLAPSGYLMWWMDKFMLCEGLDDYLKYAPACRIVDLITWDKMRTGMGYRSRRRCEYLVVVQKKPQEAKQSWSRHDIPDVWSEKIDKPKSNHPHKKPTKLIEALIEATTVPGDLIVDPCAGSGVVLECAARMDRMFFGCDIQGEYVI